MMMVRILLIFFRISSTPFFNVWAASNKIRANADFSRAVSHYRTGYFVYLKPITLSHLWFDIP